MTGNTGRGGGQYGNKNAEKWDEQTLLKIGQELIDWLNKPPQYDITDDGKTIIKSINLFKNEFLMQKGLYRDFINQMCHTYKSFADLIKKAEELQEYNLQKYALTNKLNPTMSIFLLKNHHKYTDKTEIKNENSFTSDTLQAIKDIFTKSEI